MSRPLVVLIGPPGAGKSRIGTTVAKRLGVRLIDTDRVIVKRHGPISDIFARDGEPRFRELERAVVHEALRGRLVEEGEDFVVALGGGAILDTDTQRELAGERVALITVTAESVLERLSNTKRPLLTGGIESWERLVAQRQPIYESLADTVWDTSRKPVTHIADQLAEWVRQESAAKRESE